MLVATAQQAQPPPSELRRGPAPLSSTALLQGPGHHPSADEGQERECHPVVHRPDAAADAGAQSPPRQGHEKLKEPEPESHPRRLPDPKSGHGDAAGYGHGKGIHRQAHRDEENRHRHPITALVNTVIAQEHMLFHLNLCRTLAFWRKTG